MEDVLSAYVTGGRTVAAGSAQSKRKRASFLDARSETAMPSRPELFRSVRELWVRIARVRNFLTRTPAPLVNHRAVSDDSRESRAVPAFISRQLDADETMRLKESARGQGVRVNEIMARDLFLAVCDWKKRSGQASGQERMRVAVPVDIRRHGELRHVTGNRASLVFLDRHGGAMGEPAQLLSGIHDEMELIKNLRLGWTFVDSLRILRTVPMLREKIRRREKCRSTCVMTNLGRWPFGHRLPRRNGHVVLGDAVLERIDCMAPLRPFTNATFNILNYAGRVSVTLHYDARVLTDDEACDLLAVYMDYLRRSLAISSVAADR
jgi:hypothetical protein